MDASADDSSGPESSYASMPPEVMALSSPWPSLVGEIEGLNEELELEFRFGHKVGPFAGAYKLGGSIKGGSSAIWAPATEEQYQAYLAWADRQSIDKTDDAEAYEQMAAFLDESGVELIDVGHTEVPLSGGALPGRGRLYRLVLEVLRALPASHIERDALRVLQIGGWGPDAAKASAYAEGTVYMYDFAISGAERTFLGLFLHELGHVHSTALDISDYHLLATDHNDIADAFAFLGVEFLLDAESRKVYQQFLVDEFIAETYLVYTSQGSRLRSFISSEGLPRVRSAWDEVYSIFRRSFDGVEYV